MTDAATPLDADPSSASPSEAPDDRRARRAALAELAAMIGEEVFY